MASASSSPRTTIPTRPTTSGRAPAVLVPSTATRVGKTRNLRRTGWGCYQTPMRAVVQRVSRAEVRVDGQIVGQISRGLAVLVGAGDERSEEGGRPLAEANF